MEREDFPYYDTVSPMYDEKIHTLVELGQHSLKNHAFGAEAFRINGGEWRRFAD